MGKKKRRQDKKIRVQFRKNREARARQNRISEDALDSEEIEDLRSDERVSGKGKLSRYRTIKSAEDDADQPLRAVDEDNCLEARILTTAGLNCLVRTSEHRELECTVRQVVKSMARDGRNAVVTGDRALVRVVNDEQGVVERVEPRHGVLSRQSAGQEHMIATNVDQALIVVSADNPPLKPNLIDRFLVSCERGEIEPLICINKSDLVSTADLQPLVGLYAQLGYRILLCSSEDGTGIETLKCWLQGKQTVLAGQSGVGKSTLINHIDEKLQLETGSVSEWSNKGKHTTRRAVMYPLGDDGWVIDTPGIRQMALWDVIKEEVEGYFIEFRPFVTLCRFPDCTHTVESDCGVKQAIIADLISSQRYDSYLKILSDEQFDE